MSRPPLKHFWAAMLCLSGSCGALWVACQPRAPSQAPAPGRRSPAIVSVAGFELTVAPSPAGELRAGYRLRASAASARAIHFMPVLELDGKPTRPAHLRTESTASQLSFIQGAPDCELTSVARLFGDRASQHIDLLLRARCEQSHRLRIGWRVDWPGGQSFVPGLGFATRGRASAPWVGRQTQSGAMVLASKQRSTIDLVAEHVGHLGAVSWGPTRELPASQVLEEHHRLILGAESLADGARRAWAFAGRELGQVHGKLEPRPEWAVLEARDDANQLVLSSRAGKDGAWELSLPPGNYSVRSLTPGGNDELRATVQAKQKWALNLVPPTPGELDLLARDGNDRPLPVRWLLRGEGETPDPMLSDRSQLNAGMLFALRGARRVSLPPGEYRITGTHGPEYGLFQRVVRIEAGQGAVVRAKLARQLELDGWVPCDFHLHQAPSFDSEVKLEDRLTALLADGIRFAAATDHNVVTDYSDALRALDPDADLSTAPGVEITTREWGHFNAFPYAIKSAPPVQDRTPVQIFAQVRRDQPQAVLQVNHPRMGDIGYFNQGKLDLKSGESQAGFSYDFDTIEVLNGFDLGNPWAIQQNLDSWYGLLENGWRFTAVGNSDSHKLVGEYAGYPRTYVAVAAGSPITPSAIVAGLRAGRVWVSNGPKLLVSLNGAGPGQLTALSAGNVLKIEIATADFVGVNRLELIVNGTRVVEQRFTSALRGATRVVELPLELVEDAWVVVVVHGDEALESILPSIDAKPLAFSNPIFVDFDGDGAFRARRAHVRNRIEAASNSSKSTLR